MNFSANSNTRPPRQRGFSLWEMAVLLGLLGVAFVAGFKLLNSLQTSRLAEQRAAQLSAGDRALEGFIAENGRLPCVDTNTDGIPGTDPDGKEDCGAIAQKGWLPVVTLGLSASTPARGAARLKYIVYRGAGADLAVAAERYNPLRLPTLLNLYSTTHTFNQLNTLDFCSGLTLAGAATSSAASAHIPGASGATVNVAYALAESGISHSLSGNLFDGLNASTDPVLESPARPGDENYDDIVRARSFADLQNTFQCPLTTLSVDAVAHAVEVGVTVNDFKLANVGNGAQLALNAGIAVAMNITAAALAAGALIAGGVVLTEAITELTAATATCVILIGCAFIPQATAAVAAATVGLAIAAAAVVTYGISFPVNAAAVLAAVIATGKAGITVVNIPATPPEILTQLQTSAIKARAKATQARADATSARTAATNALATYNSNATNLYTVAHTYISGSSNDANLKAAVDAYVTYAQAAQDYSNASADAQAKRKQANSDAAAAAAVITPAAMAAAADAAADAAEAAAAADPTNVAKQQEAIAKRNVANKAAEAAASTDPVTAKAFTDAYNAALAKAAASDSAADSAEAALPGKLTTRENALASYTSARMIALVVYSTTIAPPALDTPQSRVAAAMDTANNSYFATGSNDTYMYKNQAATSLESTASSAETNATALEKAYNDLAAAGIGGGPTSGGPALAIFSAGEGILKAVDLKGALE